MGRRFMDRLTSYLKAADDIYPRGAISIQESFVIFRAVRLLLIAQEIQSTALREREA